MWGGRDGVGEEGGGGGNTGLFANSLDDGVGKKKKIIFCCHLFLST